MPAHENRLSVPVLNETIATSTWLSQAVVYNLVPVYSIFLYFSGYFSGVFFFILEEMLYKSSQMPSGKKDAAESRL